MNLDDIDRQKSSGREPMQLELRLGEQGEARGNQRSVEISTAVHDHESSGKDPLMERVVERSNLQEALKRVKRNKGSAGIDGMSVKELPAYLVKNWERVREELLAGRYRPQPVKKVEIPKPTGGVRQLGIPTVLDRFIQQAILQVLQPRFDPTFSEHSYGFRPGRSAHDAVKSAQGYIQEGRNWVVDVDLEKFFDRVNHDILMERLARRITDKRLLKLIRRYLNAGIMADGVVIERNEGTPQGGPLSPLLANVLLDEVDKELEKRGHAFVRYADDGNVYVRSKRAAEDVMAMLKKQYAKLRLKVNETKSRVRRVWQSQFLGYSFWKDQTGVKRRVSAKALNRLKERVRELSSRTAGRNIEQTTERLKDYLIGWKEYFRLSETPGILTEVDGWIRRRLRMIRVKQWKCGTTAFRELRRKGVSRVTAAACAGSMSSWWKAAGSRAMALALPNSYFDALGLPHLGR
jgi:RNA-directed DNA polymerase